MSETVAQIVAQLPRLSQHERADVAYAALLSLEPDEAGVEDAWEQELARRLESIKNGTAIAIPAEQVFAEWRNRS